jgi:signal transduction histidine kinase
LSSIRSFAQFLREQSGDKMDHEGRDYLDRIERAAKYMDLLLLDLLQYSRLSSCELDLLKVDIDAAVGDVLASIEPEINERKAEIQVRRPLGNVVAHPATLRQVLYNLISNSLKFVGPQQPPRVELWAEPRGGVVRVWVADWGIGIPVQYHKKIFGLFQRLHSQEAYPGTGVGLALVRKGIERMGGRIGVDAQESQGTRFWFELPAPALAE